MKKLTVAEYAAQNNISKAAVYKRISKGKLKTIEEEIEGRTVKYIIDEHGANSTTIQPNSTDFNPPLNQSQPNSTADSTDFNPSSTPISTDDSTDIQPPLTDVFEFLKEQLREKDKQIERLQEQLAKTNELLRNAQALQAQSNYLLNEKNAPQDEESEVIVEEGQEKKEEPKKKKSFFNWLFGID